MVFQQRRLEATSYRIPVLPRQFFHAALILFPFDFFYFCHLLLALCHGLQMGDLPFPKSKPLTRNLYKVPFCTFFDLAKPAGEMRSSIAEPETADLAAQQGSPTSNVMVCIELKKIAWRLDIRWFRWFRWFRWWLKTMVGPAEIIVAVTPVQMGGLSGWTVN